MPSTVRSVPSTSPGAVLLASALLLLACGKEDLRFVLEKKPIPELPYQEFRRDIPAARRGNAAFSKAVFTSDGRYLVTLGVGVHVWDAQTGTLLRTLTVEWDHARRGGGLHPGNG